jgi:hypothetical protein
MHNAQKFAATARQTAASGGLALSEVTGAASVGSQISRSIGGLGSQGANAGARTIGQIGTANKMGILSEEDIYNVTGLMGAEGRQAYAMSAMQSSAKFLSGGRGRRMLASMAGKNGTLDESAVQKFLSGGMGIGDTMHEDAAHVTGAGAPVNRANFIRNEGRLRGAAMERLGGFLPAMQMMQWASSKGVDINNMDDRSMLFAQRQLGMGRDEVDQAVKMAQNMPTILRQQAADQQSDQYFQQLGQARKGQGVEGVKQRFAQAKEQINNKLQKVGQDIYNSGSEQIDSFFNKLFGTYVQSYSKDIDSNMNSMLNRHGTASSARAAQRLGGLTGGPGGGMGTQQADLADVLNRGSGSGMGGLASALTGGLSEGVKWAMFGKSGVEQLKEQGIDIRGQNSAQIRSTLKTAQAVREAAATGFDEKAIAAAAGGDFLSRAYGMKDMGAGMERVDNIVDTIAKNAMGDPTDKNVIAAKAMSAQIAAAKGDKVKIAGLIGNYERTMKVDPSAQLGNKGGLGEDQLAKLMAKQGPKGYASSGEESRAFANAAGIRGYGKEGGLAGRVGLLAAGALLGPVGMGVASFFGKGILGAPTEREKQAGDYLKGEDFRETNLNLHAGGEAAKAATARLNQEVSKAMAEGHSSQGDVEIKQNMLAGVSYQQFADAQRAKTGKDPTPEEEEKWLKEQKEKGGVSDGTTIDSIKTMARGGDRAVQEQQNRDNDAAWRRQKVASGTAVKGLASAGIIDNNGKLTSAGSLALGQDKNGFMATYAQQMLDQERKMAEGGHLTQAELEGRSAGLSHMTVEQQRKLAQTMSGTSIGAEAGFSAQVGQSLMTGAKRGEARSTTISKMLGTGLGKDDLAGLNKDQQAQKMLESLGVKDEDGALKKDLIGALSTRGSHGSDKMKELLSNKDVQEGKAKKDAAQQEADNPLAARQAKAAEQTNTLLNKLVLYSGQTADEISKLKAADAEGKKGPGT